MTTTTVESGDCLDTGTTDIYVSNVEEGACITDEDGSYARVYCDVSGTKH